MDDLRRGLPFIVSVAVENARLRSALRARAARLLTRFEEAKSHLMQTEKMASLGQLAAGIAHEINNPISYIGSNLNALHDYVEDLLRILGAYESVEQSLGPACMRRWRLLARVSTFLSEGGCACPDR